MNSITGKCLCGQITVSITKEAFDATGNTGVCHCKNCRQASGSFASINIRVPESAVKITGQPKIYQDSDTDSGNTIQRAFCSNCGSPIYSAVPTMPGIQVVKLGLFDEIPKPAIELFCKRRPSWNKPIDGAKQFDAMPTK
jgi:hypothetical protein